MKLKSETELVNTQVKLRELEELYEACGRRDTDSPRVRELTLHSLKRIINQLKEEIAVFEAHRLVKR
jgi:hypothetical protein